MITSTADNAVDIKKQMVIVHCRVYRNGHGGAGCWSWGAPRASGKVAAWRLWSWLQMQNELFTEMKRDRWSRGDTDAACHEQINCNGRVKILPLYQHNNKKVKAMSFRKIAVDLNQWQVHQPKRWNLRGAKCCQSNSLHRNIGRQCMAVAVKNRSGRSTINAPDRLIKKFSCLAVCIVVAWRTPCRSVISLAYRVDWYLDKVSFLSLLKTRELKWDIWNTECSLLNDTDSREDNFNTVEPKLSKNQLHMLATINGLRFGKAFYYY